MFWHYTTGRHIDAIFQSQRLAPRVPAWAPAGLAVVWFSTQPDWEPTANCAFQRPGTQHRLLGTREMTDLLCDGLFRISVRRSVRIVTWQTYCERCRLMPRNVEACRRMAAIEGSHPGRWLASFDSIGVENWLRVERWYGSEWGVIEGMEEIVPQNHEPVRHLQAAG